MKKFGTFITILILTFTLVGASEAKAYSYTTYSYSGTEQQLINYLLQLIAQLQAQIELQNRTQNRTYVQYYGPSYSNDGKNVVGKARPRGRSSRSNNDVEPEVNTLSARNIKHDRAELRGEVDMNDFKDGRVFFVYGQDEDQVEDIENDYDTYSDIDEDGDDLQKVQVDSRLDGKKSYWRTVWGLDRNTNYYFQICVEYEDEDDDQTIACGGVEEFKTNR